MSDSSERGLNTEGDTDGHPRFRKLHHRPIIPPRSVSVPFLLIEWNRPHRATFPYDCVFSFREVFRAAATASTRPSGLLAETCNWASASLTVGTNPVWSSRTL